MDRHLRSIKIAYYDAVIFFEFDSYYHVDPHPTRMDGLWLIEKFVVMEMGIGKYTSDIDNAIVAVCLSDGQTEPVTCVHLDNEPITVKKHKYVRMMKWSDVYTGLSRITDAASGDRFIESLGLH